jgi:hypothetical protein
VIARLHEEKGHRFLISALPSIVARIGPLNVLLAGDGNLRPELEKQIAALGLGTMVRFLGRRPDVAELISLSDVVVLPTLADSFGLAVLETMSLGKPVVAKSSSTERQGFSFPRPQLSLSPTLSAASSPSRAWRKDSARQVKSVLLYSRPNA